MTIKHGTLTRDQFTLDYTITGTGQPALVIGDTTFYPRTFSDELANHLQLIFMAHRGFGAATAPFTNADFALDRLVEDIEALRQTLQLDRVILIGHSGHGYIAMAYAHQYPQHVAHLVLIALSPDSTPASFAAADQAFAESVWPERKAILAENVQKMGAEIDAEPHRAFIIRSLRLGAMIWYNPAYDATPLWAGVTVIPEMFAYVWGQLFRELDITPWLDGLTMPVLLLLGRYDYWNPPHLWENVRQQFPDLTVRVFERSGHYPQLEQPADFERELLAWLAEKGL